MNKAILALALLAACGGTTNVTNEIGSNSGCVLTISGGPAGTYDCRVVAGHNFSPNGVNHNMGVGIFAHWEGMLNSFEFVYDSKSGSLTTGTFNAASQGVCSVTEPYYDWSQYGTHGSYSLTLTSLGNPTSTVDGMMYLDVHGSAFGIVPAGAGSGSSTVTYSVVF